MTAAVCFFPSCYAAGQCRHGLQLRPGLMARRARKRQRQQHHQRQQHAPVAAADAPPADARPLELDGRELLILRRWRKGESLTVLAAEFGNGAKAYQFADVIIDLLRRAKRRT